MNKNEMKVNELMKLSKEELQKMFKEANEEFNKIDGKVEQYSEKSESWHVALRRRKRLETALDKVKYAQYDFPTTTTVGSHELGPLPRLS
jgi:uncharacterized lipoprotein YehR (DUF1307 family)